MEYTVLLESFFHKGSVGIVKMYVGVTDGNWFNYLAQKKPDEVNFWKPKGSKAFKTINQGELFLFKLHSPLNYVVGGGFFVRHAFLPLSLAWEVFSDKNGATDFYSFSNAIYKYRNTNRQTEPDPVIGCNILTSPFFFEQSEWIPIPEDWKPNIVQGKSYDTSTLIGRRLYNQVQERLNRLIQSDNDKERYGTAQTVHTRLGQGAFRILVTEAYQRRCAITGEKTLPVLESAHIKPYSLEGPHSINNGLLLRKDVHTLFDRGYITVNEDLHIEVSRRIKEDYGNGKEYYAFHGKQLVETPNLTQEKPSTDFLRWHNDNIYLA